MMDFEEFKEKIEESIQAYLPEKYEEGKVIMYQADRINDSVTFLLLKTEGKDIIPAVNLDQLYERYVAGEMTFENVMGAISNQIRQGVPAGLDNDIMSNYEKAKETLFIRVCGTEQNKDLLETVPHKNVEDMALTYHLLISDGDELIGSVMVTNTHFKAYGVTLEQLHQDALENSPKLFPVNFAAMQELLMDSIRMEMELEGMPSLMQDMMLEPMYPEGVVTPYVITNQSNFNGAGALFYPDMMEEIAEKLGKDYIVLPSSVHEMIIMPDDGTASSREMELMVAEVNKEIVNPKDRLTNNAYHYDRKDHVFERFSSFESRMTEKEKAASRDETGRQTSSSPKRESVLKRLDEKKAIVKAREEGKGKTEVRDVNKKKDHTLA